MNLQQMANKSTDLENSTRLDLGPTMGPTTNKESKETLEKQINLSLDDHAQNFIADYKQMSAIQNNIQDKS